MRIKSALTVVKAVLADILYARSCVDHFNAPPF
jgi:hypothetical protein